MNTLFPCAWLHAWNVASQFLGNHACMTEADSIMMADADCRKRKALRHVSPHMFLHDKSVHFEILMSSSCPTRCPHMQGRMQNLACQP